MVPVTKPAGRRGAGVVSEQGCDKGVWCDATQGRGSRTQTAVRRQLRQQQGLVGHDDNTETESWIEWCHRHIAFQDPRSHGKWQRCGAKPNFPKRHHLTLEFKRSALPRKGGVQQPPSPSASSPLSPAWPLFCFAGCRSMLPGPEGNYMCNLMWEHKIWKQDPSSLTAWV